MSCPMKIICVRVHLFACVRAFSDYVMMCTYPDGDCVIQQYD